MYQQYRSVPCFVWESFFLQSKEDNQWGTGNVFYEYQGSGTKNGAAAFIYRFGIYGIFGNHDFAGRTVQLFWMYEKGDICKSGEGGNDSATNNGAAFSSTKQRSCLFFFDEEQSGKKEMVRENILESVRMLMGIP